MRIETLNERIENAKAKIEKKTNTIAKKTALIEKKRATIAKHSISPNDDMFIHRDNSEVFWLMCDIETLKEDIQRGESEIEETRKSLEKYEMQLAGEIEKEAIVLKVVPESMRRMQAELVESWDAFDIARRDQIRKDRDTMDRKAYCKKYSASDRFDFIYKTNEQIHRANENDAKTLVLNLYYRIKDITGEVVDWDGITATIGTHGFTVLNGLVIGKEGRARVESIFAGGYNIQRLHVRVLVHSL